MMSILRGAAAQLKAVFGSRLGLVLLVLFTSMSIVTGAVYDQLVLRDVPFIVVDRDNTHFTRLITTSLDATPELEVSIDRSSSIETARARLEQGAVGGYLLIPSGATEQLKRGAKAEIVLAVDMSNVLIGKTVRSACSRVIGTLNAGTEMAVLRKMGSSRAAASSEAVPIVLEDNQLFNPATNYAEYLVPVAVYFLLHIYATVLFAGVFLRKQPATEVMERFGRLLVVWVLSVGLSIGVWLLLPRAHIAIASPCRVFVAVFASYALAQAAFAGCLSVVVPHPRLAFQSTLFLSMLGLMLSGVTWPTYEFPSALAQLSEVLPFTHLARLLRVTVHSPATLADVWDGTLLLAKLATGFALLGGVVAGLRRLLILSWQARFHHVAR